MSILVHLSQFEGPLSLLLYLIRKNEMDIYDIEITKITEQYLEYIKIMKELDLEVAGDFVAMAATLIHIKSKMLLPQYDENGEVVENEDPRKELINRLVEYQKYQEASKQLKQRPLLNRNVYLRGYREIHGEGDSAIILDERGLFAMIALYRKVIRKVKKNVHMVMEKVQSIASRVLEIRDRLIPGEQTVFTELLKKEVDRSKLVLTFITILELARLGFINVFQSETYGPIHINTKRSIDRDMIGDVQEFENRPVEPVKLGQALDGDSIEEIAASDEELDLAEAQMAESLDAPQVVDIEATSPDVETVALSEDESVEVSVDEGINENINANIEVTTDTDVIVDPENAIHEVSVSPEEALPLDVTEELAEIEAQEQQIDASDSDEISNKSKSALSVASEALKSFENTSLVLSDFREGDKPEDPEANT